MRKLLPKIEYADSAMKALQDADACVLVTEWQEFLTLDWAKAKEIMRRPILVDGRNALDAAALVNLGFSYEGIGTRTPRP